MSALYVDYHLKSVSSFTVTTRGHVDSHPGQLRLAIDQSVGAMNNGMFYFAVICVKD